MPLPALLSLLAETPIQRAARADDPVCGRSVGLYTAAASTIFRGSAYYFCSNDCHARFTREPGKYHVPGETTHTDELLAGIF